MKKHVSSNNNHGSNQTVNSNADRFSRYECKTSLTCGQALCGRVGGKIRSEYAMVGDVINLAARLMGKAKGRIVCDEVTHDLVSQQSISR